MDSGLYGLFALDGAPIMPEERLKFGRPAHGLAEHASTHAIIQAVDIGYPDAAHCMSVGADVVALVGYLDEAEELAAALGMAKATPEPLLLHAATLRWGDDTPTHVRGEWSFLLWRGGERELTLLSSLHRRDHVLYAVRDGRVAIAPHCRWLMQFDWVESHLSVEGFLGQIGRAGVRPALSDRAQIIGARRLRPGTRLVINNAGTLVGKAAPLPAISDWRGSFDDAIAETDAILRRLFRQRLAREQTVAVTLSGGLDSSLVAMYAAQECRAGQKVIALTSAAPPGSGLSDETAFAKIVADHLGIPIEFVVPAPDANAYHPLERNWSTAQAPACSPRHYLYDALADAAVRYGATTILEGSMGEMTVTYPFPLQPARPTLRSRLRAVRDAFRRPPPEGPWPYCGFHAMIAPELAAQVPDSLKAAWDARPPDDVVIDPQQRWGYYPTVAKLGDGSTATGIAGLRVSLPFRDVRLLQNAARFPAAFMQNEGVLRAPARALMRGQLPDSIRLRPKGTAFSPDYYQRLQRQAAGARARVALFREAGIGDWLDLGWLEAELRRIHTNGLRNVPEAFKAQTTATTAEFLIWWFTSTL